MRSPEENMKLALLILMALFLVVSAFAQPVTPAAEAPYARTRKIFRMPVADTPLAARASEAADSIAAFIIEQNNAAADPSAAQPHVLPAALTGLRPPPRIPSDPSRYYTAVEVKGWRAPDPARLAFTIEYANPQQPRSRYLDHYVFVRQGKDWLFERHGDAVPRQWEISQEVRLPRN